SQRSRHAVGLLSMTCRGASTSAGSPAWCLKSSSARTRWADVVRRVSTADGVVAIAAHPAAQAFFGAAGQQGELPKSALMTYLEAGFSHRRIGQDFVRLLGLRSNCGNGGGAC